MISLRWLLALVVVAGVASVSLFALERDQRVDAGPWLPEIAQDVAKVDRIALYQGSEEPRVELRRSDNQWQVVSLDGYAAEIGVLRELVAALVDASRLEPRSDNPERFAALGLGDPRLADSEAILLQLAQGDQALYQLVLGRSSGVGQLVRRLQARQSWLISEQIPASLEPMDWVDNLLLNEPASALTGIVFRGGDQSFEMQRDAGSWQVSPVPEGRELRAQPFLAQPAEALSGLRFSAVGSGATQPPEDALASVEYRFDDGGRITAWRLPEETGLWVQFSVAAPADPVERNWDELAGQLSGWRFQFPVHRMATLFRPLEEQLIPAAESDSAQ